MLQSTMKLSITKLKAKDLIWDKWNRKHIQKHDLHPRQVEQILLDKNLIHKPTYGGRILLSGVCGRRLLTVILSLEKKNYYVVSARDASKEERQTYRENYEKRVQI